MAARAPRSSRANAGKERRAFTPARTPGRIEQGGDAELASRLARALEQAHQAPEFAEQLTHPLHTYPARMHPATARELIAVTLAGAPGDLPGKVLLDPFCGSGTTLVEGRHAGLCTVGVDANPLAALIARAKTWTVAPERRAQLRQEGRRIARSAWNEGKAARRAGYEPPPLRAPRGVDAEARNRRLAHWFAPHVRRELEHIAAEIDHIRHGSPDGGDGELADILTVALSAILYKVSRRASDTDPARVERRVGRGAASRLFRERIDLLVAGLGDLSRAADAPPGRVHCADARDLRALGIDDASVHAVVTSPPYAGTYDYAEQHRLRLDFLGMSGKAFRQAEMGSRRQFAETGEARRRARRRWGRALGHALAEVARVLAPGGRAAVMLGDSVAGDRAIRADEALAAALPDPLEVVAWAWQERPALGRPERDAFAGRPKRECIFLLGR